MTRPFCLVRHGRTVPAGDGAFVDRLESLVGRALKLQKRGPKPELSHVSPEPEDVQDAWDEAIGKVKADKEYHESRVESRGSRAATTNSQRKRWKHPPGTVPVFVRRKRDCPPCPKYIICDKGKQFDCPAFRTWCKSKHIKPPRYGAVGRHGSIAVVERFILTLKTLLAWLCLVPFRRRRFQQELNHLVEWYNEFRPHSSLGGRTPNEVYYGRFPGK